MRFTPVWIANLLVICVEENPKIFLRSSATIPISPTSPRPWL